MYIVPGQYAETFREIRNSSLSHSTCKVVIFVSCLDIDALCAAKIVASLFKMDLIPHKIMPIVGYQEFKQKYNDLDDEIKNVICLGCGATTDLESFFDIVGDEGSDHPGRKIYIIDNHRPWSLDNLFASENVVCFDDGTIDEKLSDHKAAYKILQELGDDEDDDDQDRSDQDTDNDEQTDTRSVASIDDEEDIYYKQPKLDSDSQKENVDPVKSAKTTRRELRALREKHHQLLEDYYSQGNYVHSSTVIQVYTLLSLIGETSVNNLWLTVVGVTSLDAQHSIIYSTLYPLLRDEVSRLCPTSNADGNTNGIGNGNDNQLHVETDYLLFLLRHWSLYDSMMHSSYLSAKLHLWTEDGRKKMHKMLAKMGISLQEAKEHWAHMNVVLKRSLKDKLTGVSGIYGIEQVIRQGIVRRYGYKGSVSAGDCVDALAALLESGAEKHMFKVAQNGSTPEKSQFWISNFWVGWDALDNVDILMAGTRRAKSLQSAVVSASTVLFEKRLIKDLRSFRLAVIREGPDLEVFKNPLALARLGSWIGEACSESHSQPLPLVVASFDPTNNSYLVLGMGPRKSRDVEVDPSSTVYNRFGPAFQATSERINAALTFDAFESSIIEVPKEDLSRFLESLTVSGVLDGAI